MSSVDYTGQTLDGKYRLLRRLGSGGMGAVYLGQHVIIGKLVAVKFLYAELSGNQEVVKRFYREAQAAASIGHKNIIDVLDVGVSSTGEPYLVMEYLEGESLAGMLERTGPIGLAAACGILEPVFHALSAAHAKGIVHRDLKPENIFLAAGQDDEPIVKIIDFGISKFTLGDKQTKLTSTGALLGTPLYMSPEQARGSADIDHRTDIYSLGVILYEMLTGGHPFVGANYNELIVTILTKPPRPPSEVFPGFPEEALPVILKAIGKEPRDRFQSMQEMLDALKSLRSFDDRREHLTLLVSGIAKKPFAGGDLGGEAAASSGGGVAEEVLAEVAKEATPGAWPATGSAVTSSRKRLFIGLGGLAAAILILVMISLSVGEREKTALPSPVQPAPAVTSARAPDDQGVLITVEGAPQEARIYYEDALVPVNPFRVKRATTIAPLRIEAPGMIVYKVSVVPSRDQVVNVEMKPAQIVERKSRTEQTVEKKTRVKRFFDRLRRIGKPRSGSAQDQPSDAKK